MGTVFLISAILSVAGAVLMAGRRNPVYGLLFLLVSFAGAAGIFYSLTATFLAVSQILVYAGAIAVLFLFVLMFVDLRRQGEHELPKRVDSLAVYDPAGTKESALHEHDRYQFSLGAAIVALVLFSIMLWVIQGLPDERFGKFHPTIAVVRPDEIEYFGSLNSFGLALLENFQLHYEIVGLVVLVGVMGAVILGKRLSDEDEEERQAQAALKTEAEAAGHDAAAGGAHH